MLNTIIGIFIGFMINKIYDYYLIKMNQNKKKKSAQELAQRCSEHMIIDMLIKKRLRIIGTVETINGIYNINENLNRRIPPLLSLPDEIDLAISENNLNKSIYNNLIRMRNIVQNLQLHRSIMYTLLEQNQEIPDRAKMYYSDSIIDLKKITCFILNPEKPEMKYDTQEFKNALFPQEGVSNYPNDPS